MLKFQILRCWK